MADAPRPGFDAVYIDTNILKAEKWPHKPPSIVLNNVFRLSAYWGIKVFLPYPVLKEAYEHWVREVNESILKITTAKRDLERIAKPAKCKINVEHTPMEKMVEEYGQNLNESIKDYGIETIPFTKRTAEEIFGFATRYLMPFGLNGQGKGFQDAVILLSILDHLNEHPEAKGILITEDKAFKDARFSDFIPGFNSDRLEIVDTLDTAHDLLWQPYFDETVIKPYRQERDAAKLAVSSMNEKLKSFVGAHLGKEMLKPSLGDTIIGIISVDDVRVWDVETPLPEQGESLNRSVDISIRLSADCTVLISRDYSYVMPFLGQLYGKGNKEATVSSPPKQMEITMMWSGEISATADIADGQFKNIALKALVPQKEG